MVLILLNELANNSWYTDLSIVNKNQSGIADFENKGKILMMNEKTKKSGISKILDKLSNKVEFKGNQLSYSDIIMCQGRFIGKFLTREDQYVGFYRHWWK